jgi:DNA-binding protein H-NS
MKIDKLSVDGLWAFHEKIAAALTNKMVAELRVLENRSRQLTGQTHLNQIAETPKRRRFYPTVAPKYRNPDQPSETWAGRGKQPRWLAAQLRSVGLGFLKLHAELEQL